MKFPFFLNNENYISYGGNHILKPGYQPLNVNRSLRPQTSDFSLVGSRCQKSNGFLAMKVIVIALLLWKAKFPHLKNIEF